jgi:hypothetical protein
MSVAERSEEKENEEKTDSGKKMVEIVAKFFPMGGEEIRKEKIIDRGIRIIKLDIVDNSYEYALITYANGIFAEIVNNEEELEKKLREYFGDYDYFRGYMEDKWAEGYTDAFVKLIMKEAESKGEFVIEFFNDGYRVKEVVIDQGIRIVKLSSGKYLLVSYTADGDYAEIMNNEKELEKTLWEYYGDPDDDFVKNIMKKLRKYE